MRVSVFLEFSLVSACLFSFAVRARVSPGITVCVTNRSVSSDENTLYTHSICSIYTSFFSQYGMLSVWSAPKTRQRFGWREGQTHISTFVLFRICCGCCCKVSACHVVVYARLHFNYARVAPERDVRLSANSLKSDSTEFTRNTLIWHMDQCVSACVWHGVCICCSLPYCR